VEDKTSTKAAGVDRPSATKHPLFPVAAVAVLILLAYAAWKVYNSPIVRITALWGIAACVVFWFSTSGGMFNIIRGMPLVTVQNGKVIWWMQVS
jgi:oligosaccharyltransferase complex subunit gamma